MAVWGGKVQPDLELAKKVDVKFKLQDGSTVETLYQKGKEESFLADMVGYAVAKYGVDTVTNLVNRWGKSVPRPVGQCEEESNGN